MLLIATVIGVLGGLGAVVFRWLIMTCQSLAWGPAGTPLERFAQSPAYLRLLVPAVGGLLVGLVVKFLAPEAKGHGVPEVMNAVARHGGVIRPVVAIAKSLASAICIATGGSVGREGPIVQIGAAMGSTLGQVLHLSARRIRTSVGCGAAAGIAATFNAPIAGAFFAAEIILGEFGVGAFSSVVVSAVSATVVSRTLLGDVPAFAIPSYAIVSPAEMFTYVFLGLLAGVVGVVFVMALNRSEELFDRLSGLPGFLKPGIGGLGIGCLGLLLPQVMGVGYDSIGHALFDRLGMGLLVILLLTKLLATSFTLGSGGSGGVFAPSLLMGASLGGTVGHLARAVFSFPMASPGAYAVVGMGAMVAAATHAPITAIMIIFEMTGDYRVMLGLMVSCILATVVAQRLRRESIYTIKLIRRGIDLQAGQDMNVLRQLHVQDILHPELETVPQSANLDCLYQHLVNSPHSEFFVVDEQGSLVGIISIDDLRRTLPHMDDLRHIVIAEDLMSRQVLFVREDDTLDCAMQQFGKRPFRELPVLPAGETMVPVGTIRRHDVINIYNREIVRLDLAGSVSARISSTNKLRTWETIGDYVLVQVEAPPHLCRQPLRFLHLRQKRGVQIILIERNEGPGNRFVFPTRETMLNPGDRIIVFGHRENVDAFGREAG
ncbi:MAG: chloride channel protein [Candidatus Krumholzibacteriia bacterium]